MSLSKKGNPINNIKLDSTAKVTTLNPNAAEFVPFALRSSSGSTSTGDASARFTPSGTLGKAKLDRSESSISNNSDEEAHQYWRCQLPDDITPDFKVMGEDESQALGGLSLAGLSLHDSTETSRFSAGSGYILNEQQELSPHHVNGNSFTDKMRYSASPYGEDPSSATFLHLPNKPWDKQIVHGDQLLSNGREGTPYNGNSRHGFVNDMLNEHAMVDETDMNPLEFLALQFPGFAAESLTEVYFANECDLNMTIEMLTQLEMEMLTQLLHIISLHSPIMEELAALERLSQNMNSKTLSAPNLSGLDFPSLPVPDGQNGLPKYAGDDIQQGVNPYRSSDKDNLLMFKSNSSIPSRGATDFASAVRKLATQDSGIWKFDRNGTADVNVGSSRSSHVLASSYNSGHGRGTYGDRLQNRGSARVAPAWVETGEAVANMYSELREEARDHARLRNAYFEQPRNKVQFYVAGILLLSYLLSLKHAAELVSEQEAQQAYLIGNKALAKELSLKGKLHSIHMKAAHGKAQEAIYRQRNPVSPELQGNARGERMIDLHGLHVSEAIHVLKHELNVLRSTARSADQRLQVYICVGTGHHTRGSRTPARLPVAVQRYLLEEEGLDYTEPQAGLLRVVIY
ncbi:Polyadenylate-binding protein-interacting protein 7 [Vitis vinifera]|uniref:Polyadenylate-binding protein-interacting protein 7 n=1 Tax=Vitis vinifera TaxID=29760 RepID=A0A438EX22_VITVI|nr:Polyadenylate-binding protein-interacting protein 7 [Vitis vinifera]